MPKKGSGPILVICHSGIAWHPVGFSLIYLQYPDVTTLMLRGHGRFVAPETASMEEGARFRLNTSHHRPDPLVTGCHAPAP
jgi:hypothetical protein